MVSFTKLTNKALLLSKISKTDKRASLCPSSGLAIGDEYSGARG
jgi:hypothetical protein